MISPLKDPHNFQCAAAVKNLIPPNSTVNVPAFFSGNLPLSLSSSGRRVRAITNKYVVYEFWKCALHDPQRIIKIAQYISSHQDPNMLYYLQEDWPTYRDPYLRSALFFLLNRLSDTGFQSYGSLTYENYNPISLNRLKAVKDHNLEVQLIADDDFIANLEQYPDSDYVVIPAGNFSYNFFQEGQNRGWETTDIDHRKIREFLSKTNKKTVIAYNSHAALGSFYEGFGQVFLNSYGVATADVKSAKEVLIANFRLS